MRTAWHCITPEVTVKGFEKGCISHVVDATDGYMLGNYIIENGNVGSDCEEDEPADCEDGDSDTNWLR
jgi:hypothetical protein